MQKALRLPSRPVVKAVLLDMDDTLFLEHSYVMSGIAVVADYLAKLTGEDVQSIKARISYRFLKFGRRRLFDTEIGNPAVCTMDEIVSVYRTHRPDIELFDGAAAALMQLIQIYPIALVTDGAQIMQKRKVQALKLENLIPHIVYCDALGSPKPSPRAFLRAAELIGVAPEHCLVIGDDPTADMAGAAAAGMHACRVMTGRYTLFPIQDDQYPRFSSFHEAVSALTVRI